MKIKKIKLVYFSATYATQKIVKLIAAELGGEAAEFDITQQAPDEDIVFESDDLLVLGMPVYAGRLPSIVLPALRRLKGNQTPAIIVCVFGNRDYDDALLELKDIAEENGFKAVSAGAFIARHSIFPEVASERPDGRDMALIKEFAQKSMALIDSTEDVSALPAIKVKGRRPYRGADKIPLIPKGNKKCNECGTCARLCVTQAIPAKTPRKTNVELCTSCGRCTVVCPQGARHFSGLLYYVAKRKFTKTHVARIEPETVFCG